MASNLRALSGGIGFLLLYNVLTATQDVYLGHLFQHQNEHPITVLVFTFSITTLFFLAFQLGSLSNFFKLFRQHFRALIWVNVYTAMAWFGFFVALKYLEPAIVSAICFGLGPILNILFWKRLRPEKPILKEEIYSAIGIFVGLLALGITSASGRSALGEMPIQHVVLGLGFCLLSAFGIVLVVLFMKRLYEKGVNAKTLMAMRFYLLIGVGILALPQGPVTTLSFWDVFMPTMLFVAAIAVIAPLYVIQLAIEKTEPITLSILMCLAPVFTYIMQLFSTQWTTSLATLVGVVLAIGSAIIGTIAAAKKEKQMAELSEANSELPEENLQKAHG